MGRPPAVIILARHGARLDAADSQWHLTSPTPYDPPLTYGGWKQSQALGARIASIIKFREDTSEALHMNGNGLERDGWTSYRTKRRKHKVVIHSSPYLRCVQTSVAISAGMAQWKGTPEVEDRSGHAKNHVLHSGSPHIKATDLWNSPHLSAIPEPDEAILRNRSPTANSNKKDKAGHIVLRLDAFLGEWLSPDYYNNITPPPGSKMMVAGAKADLLRRGDPIDVAQSTSNVNLNQGNFPGGWKSDGRPLDEPKKPIRDTMRGMAELSQALPKLGRANSHSVIPTGMRSSFQLTSRVDGGPSSESAGYIPPTPSYAISPTQPIPDGYVAHARDACIRVDYQWDSMRPPLEWGNGGDYGEEWSAMHRRFRRGLHKMISLYRNHEAFQEVDVEVDGMEELSHTRTGPSDTADDEESDTVLILVTHGAGCNALIGALTNQPVLIDVGMASLTMAVRKNVEYKRLPQSEPSSTSPTLPRRRSSIEPATSEEYDVRITASTDHLRPGSEFLSTTPSRLRSPILTVREKSPYRYEKHVGATTHHHTSRPVRDNFDAKTAKGDGGSFEEKTLGPSPRAATSAAFSGGLWSPASHPAKRPTPDGARNIMPQLEQGKEAANSRPRSFHIESAPMTSETGAMRENGSAYGNGKTLAQQGLWGTEPKALGTERDRTTPKRRWTSTQA
ncbi:MAG: hypothetical protein Q9217_000617 [Psora testacea]